MSRSRIRGSGRVGSRLQGPRRRALKRGRQRRVASADILSSPLSLSLTPSMAGAHRSRFRRAAAYCGAPRRGGILAVAVGVVSWGHWCRGTRILTTGGGGLRVGSMTTRSPRLVATAGTDASSLAGSNVDSEARDGQWAVAVGSDMSSMDRAPQWAFVIFCSYYSY